MKSTHTYFFQNHYTVHFIQYTRGKAELCSAKQS